MFRALIARIAGVVERGAALVRNAATSPYEAGSIGTRRTALWRSPTSTANSGVLANLTTLRDRSRNAARNDGYAKGALDKLVTNIMGTGIKPLSMATDPAFRVQVQALWTRWTDESDADGLLDWYGQVAQAVRVWLEAGEGFVRLRPRLASDGLSVPLQMQVLEPELCPHTHNVFSATQKIRAGIEINALGRRTAYWFHPSRPEYDDFDASQLRRIPAENVVHLFEPLRAGQLRGVPQLTQALIRLYGLDKYDDAALTRQELANMFMMFHKRSGPVGASETTHPLTGQPIQTVNDTPLLEMYPGITQELEPGEDVDFSDPPEVRGYPEFMRQQLLGVSAATGVPYEVLTGDMSRVNDRTVRVILHEFRRRVQAWQHHIVVYQLCRVVWRAWMDRVFLSGALPIPIAYVENPEPWAAVRWVPQGWPYIHPVQDVEANEKAVRDGFRSRSAVVGEQGDDAEVIDAEQAADNARADKLGLRYDSDGRNAKTVAPTSSSSTDDAPADPKQPTQTDEVAA